MTTEFTSDWQKDFIIAIDGLRDELKRMLQTDIYKDPKELIEWIRDTNKKAFNVSPICTDNYLPIYLCDELSARFGDIELKKIIKYAGDQNITSTIEASDLKYHAIYVIDKILELDNSKI